MQSVVIAICYTVESEWYQTVQNIIVYILLVDMYWFFREFQRHAQVLKHPQHWNGQTTIPLHTSQFHWGVNDGAYLNCVCRFSKSPAAFAITIWPQGVCNVVTA